MDGKSTASDKYDFFHVGSVNMVELSAFVPMIVATVVYGVLIVLHNIFGKVKVEE